MTRVAMAGPWSAEETKALLDVWGADSVQGHLNGVVRNRVVYQKVANSMMELGYERSWQQYKFPCPTVCTVSCTKDQEQDEQQPS